MKKIIPFNNVLDFSTDVCDITAISLEHDIEKEEDVVSGHFYISGEYKITNGQVDREKFNFDLPFDIALSNNYNLDTLVVDIDDFRYELIDNNKLKVNIDLYIDGEVIEEPFFEPIERTIEELPAVEEPETASEETSDELPEERLELLDEMLTSDEEKEMEENNNNENTNINIFNGFDENENYVTYRVYRVLENDTLDSIIEKYNITKEMLASYNNIEDIKPGDKLIIPAND